MNNIYFRTKVERELTFVPAGPRGPSGPFTDSRQRTRGQSGWPVKNSMWTQKRGTSVLIKVLENSRDAADSLAGLELREFLLRLSDLCCRAPLGRLHPPGDHSDVTLSKLWNLLLNPTTTHLISFNRSICIVEWQIVGQHVPSHLSRLSAEPGHRPASTHIWKFTYTVALPYLCRQS